MKILNIYSVLAFFLIIAVGCDKTDEPAIGECLITKQSYSDEDFSREILFFYNSNNQPIRLTGTTSTGFSGEAVLTYNATGQLIKAEGSLYAPLAFYTYTYNTKNLLIRTEGFMSTGVLERKIEYEYNAFDQLISEKSFENDQGTLVANFPRSYEYKTTTSKDYFIEKLFHTDGSLYSTTEYEYDDKKTPFGMIEPNGRTKNVVKETVKDATGTVTSVKTIVYEYNSLGYPTKSVSNSTQFNGVETYTFTYDCK
ncbi:MAG: hypothetical protein ACK5DD_03210 [Cyclobacteriaceae bacterium]|jgi:hypothetical protein